MRRALSLCNTVRLSNILVSPHRLPVVTLLAHNRRFCTSKSTLPVTENHDEIINFSEKTPQSTIERKSVKTILLTASAGDVVRVQGWVRVCRKQKFHAFFDISDGSSFHFMPVVCSAKLIPKDLGMHSSVDVTGRLHVSPKNSTLLEIHPTEPIVVTGTCDQLQFPFGGKITYETEYIRQYLHLRPKTNRFSSLFRLRNTATRAINDYFHENNFIQVHTPILTSNDCEGAGEVFLVRPANENLMIERSNAPETLQTSLRKIVGVQSHEHEDVPNDGLKHTHSHLCVYCREPFEHTHSKKPLEISQAYDNHYCEKHMHMRKENPQNVQPTPQINPDESFFNQKAFLTVSAQLHLEAFASGFEKVWTFSPVFRCENAKSTRHLSEFYMVEAEMAFISRIEQLLQVMENLVKFIVRRVVYDNAPEWNSFTESNLDLKMRMDKILKQPFTVMTYQEAVHLLQSKLNSQVNPLQGLNREQELLLVEKLNDDVPVFLINWPSDIKPFYMKRLPEDPSLSVVNLQCSAVDLLVPSVGELCGGSLRENDLSLLTSRTRSLDPSGKLEQNLHWYFDLRRFGSVPTGGFGLGFDRIMQLLLDVHNIKDVSPFPRWPHHCPF